MAQEETFEKSGVKALLDSALDGFSATVFAYGQTGSGKTYTMVGVESGSPAAPARSCIAPRVLTARGAIGGETYHPSCFDGIIPRSVQGCSPRCHRTCGCHASAVEWR